LERRSGERRPSETAGEGSRRRETRERRRVVSEVSNGASPNFGLCRAQGATCPVDLDEELTDCGARRLSAKRSP